LIVSALEARTLVATHEGRYDEACVWADRAVEVAPSVGDRGMLSHQSWNAGFVYLRAGRLEEAGRFAGDFERLGSELDAHDEVHAVALRALIAALAGRWQELADLIVRVEAASAANEAYPCQFNWRTLLVCALGAVHAGPAREARRLEALGRQSAVVAGPAEREPALLRIAVFRRDRDAMRRMLELLPAAGQPYDVDSPAARLDALATLGDAAAVEKEAAVFLDHPGYTRPFALRALAVVRGDESLRAAAATSFGAMGLTWRARETRTFPG